MSQFKLSLVTDLTKFSQKVTGLTLLPNRINKLVWLPACYVGVMKSEEQKRDQIHQENQMKENGTIIISWIAISAIEKENGQIRQRLSTLEEAEYWMMNGDVLCEYGE